MKILNFEDFVNENYSINEGLFGFFGDKSVDDLQKSITTNQRIIKNIVKIFTKSQDESVNVNAALWDGVSGMWNPEPGILISKKDILTKVLPYSLEEVEKKGEISLWIGIGDDEFKLAGKIKSSDINNKKVKKDVIKSFSKLVMKKYIDVFDKTSLEEIKKIYSDDTKKKKTIEDKYTQFVSIVKKCEEDGTLLVTDLDKIKNKLDL